MKKELLVVAIVVGLCGTALALDPMGPPASGLSKGQSSLGVEYSYSEMSLYRNHSYDSSGANVDTEMNKVYVRLGYGISDKTEGFVRLGVSDYEYERGTSGSGKWKGDDDGAFALGVGVKTTFSDEVDIKWGGLAQASWATYTGGRKNPNASSEKQGNFETDITELQLAVGPTWTPEEGVSIYGGPFLHFVSGAHTHSHASGSGDYGLNEKTNFGGYVGAQIELAENSALTVEYLRTSDSWGVAGGICWTY